MLVAVESDAVAKPVREIFVARTVPRAGNDRARRVIDAAGEPARTRRIQRRVLGLASDFEGLRDFVGRLAENSRPCDVGSITVNPAAAVYQDNIAFFQGLRLASPVWQCRGWPQQY